MTMFSTIDGGVTQAVQPQTQGYWDNPLTGPHGHDHDHDHDHGPVGSDAGPVGDLLDSGSQVSADEHSQDGPGLQASGIDGNEVNSKDRVTSQTPDGKPVYGDPLHQDANVGVVRERTVSGQYVVNDQLVFTTAGTGDDKVGVTQRDDGTLDVKVNGESYEVRLAEGQELTLRTGEGNDVIEVAPNVRVNIVINGGDGDNRIALSGSGDSRIETGAGSDVIDLSASSGRNDVFAGAGDDKILGGSGVNVLYAGDGNDSISAGPGTNYVEGGAGNDEIFGGGKSDILSGGVGDDTIRVGEGKSTVYAGAGNDRVEGATADTTVYAEAIDQVSAASGARPTVVNVEIDADVGHTVKIEGSPAFVQRMQAEIDFLRSSPNGQQMLAEFDKAAEAKGNVVTIKELSNEQNGYAQTFSRDANIVNGKPGTGGDVTISYNPSFHMDAFPAPVVVLFHEMSHAYNGVNGTFLTGTYRGEGPDNGRVPNAERQAVGLESSAPAYDFDGDPSTPPTTHNPIHLTENGIRRELGLPDRPSYAL